MSVIAATWLVTILGIYLVLGLAFALFFVFFAAGGVDPAASEGTWGFRVLILPGVAAFWPLFLGRLLTGVTAPPVERHPHRQAARDAGGEP